jgi:hypothetical protein
LPGGHTRHISKKKNKKEEQDNQNLVSQGVDLKLIRMSSPPYPHPHPILSEQRWKSERMKELKGKEKKRVGRYF